MNNTETKQLILFAYWSITRPYYTESELQRLIIISVHHGNDHAVDEAIYIVRLLIHAGVQFCYSRQFSHRYLKIT